MAKKATDKYQFSQTGRFFDARFQRIIEPEKLSLEEADQCFKAGSTWLELKPKPTKTEDKG